MQCTSGAVTCSVTEGTAVAVPYNRPKDEHPSRATLQLPSFDFTNRVTLTVCPQSPPLPLVGTMDVCLPNATFGFHGTRSPTQISFSTKCQFQRDATSGQLVLALTKAVDSYDGTRIYPDAITCADYYGRDSQMNESYHVVTPTDRERTCPVLGHNAVASMDTSNCTKPSKTAICTYNRNTIAGGCQDRPCVEAGIAKFVAAARNMSTRSALQGSQRMMQDSLLAGLLMGLRDGLGDCGQTGRSCLARLAGNCGPLSQAATDMQRLDRPALYDAFMRASETCISESGERDRP
jgi:hypothetical protein